MRKLLAEVYGIKTDSQLNDALAEMKKLNIGVFTAPVMRTKGAKP